MGLDSAVPSVVVVVVVVVVAPPPKRQKPVSIHEGSHPAAPTASSVKKTRME